MAISLNGERHHLDMANYIGPGIAQIIVDNQTVMNERIAEMSERLARIETRMDGFQIDNLWHKVRYHDKVLYAGIAIGGIGVWFAKVILGR